MCEPTNLTSCVDRGRRSVMKLEEVHAGSERWELKRAARDRRRRASYSKNVSGSAQFVRSDLHGLGRMWRGNESQRMLDQVTGALWWWPRRKYLNVIGHHFSSARQAITICGRRSPTMLAEARKTWNASPQELREQLWNTRLSRGG